MKHQNETGALRKAPWPRKAIATVCALAMALLSSVPLGVFHAPEFAWASSEPVLAQEATWYKGSTEKSAITAIDIVDSYAADGSEAESWDASADQDGSVMAYISADGTTLTIAGNGSGAIRANAYSAFAFSNFGNVTGISGLSMLDTSSTVDMSGFFENDGKLASVSGIENWGVGECTLFASIFRGCEALTSIDISNWDALSAESLESITSSCTHPAGLMAPAVKTASPTSASGALDDRQTLKNPSTTTLDIHDAEANATETPTLAEEATWYKGTAEKSTIKSIKIVNSYVADGSEAESWDASADQDGSVMAYISADGTTLTIAGNGSGSIKTDWSTSDAFKGFSSVTEIDNIELFDVSGTSYMENMFYNCSSLTSLNLDDWDVSNVDSFRYTFDRCSSLTSLGPNGLRDWDTSNVTYFFGTFQFCSALTNIDVSQWDLSTCRNIDTMFAYCKSLTSIDVSDWDVSKVTNMMSTFNTCTSLQSIDVSRWDTSSARSMNGLFANCELLTEIDVSGFDTSSCVSFGLMFSGCEKLESVDVSRFSTGKVENFQAMFDSCESLGAIDTSKWNTANATDMSFLFDGCVKLAVPDMSNWSTSNVTTMQDMFRGCTSMVNLDLTMFDTSRCTKFDGTFESCSNLKTLDISSWDTTSASIMLNMFSKCLRLQQVSLGERFSFTGNGSASCVLPTPDPAYITGAIGKWQAVGSGTVDAPTGTVYAPADVPSNVAETYVMPMITVDIDVPVKVILAVDAEGNFVTPTATANKIVNHTAVGAKVVSAVATAAGSFRLEKASALSSSDTDNIFGGSIVAGNGSSSDLTDISTTGDSWSMAKGSVADGSNQIPLQLTGAVKNVKGSYLTAPTSVFGIAYTFELNI